VRKESIRRIVGEGDGEDGITSSNIVEWPESLQLATRYPSSDAALGKGETCVMDRAAKGRSIPTARGPDFASVMHRVGG
jgi:hypothetical protein